MAHLTLFLFYINCNIFINKNYNLKKNFGKFHKNKFLIRENMLMLFLHLNVSI